MSAARVVVEDRVFWRGEAQSGLVLIRADALKILLSYVQKDSDMKEAGGILIGCRKHGNHIDIHVVTEPGRWDRRRRHSFVRSREPHQRICREQWRKSDGYMTYLGEWHTHPELKPLPSAMDLEGWHKQQQRCGLPLVGLIVGMEDLWLGIIDSEGEHQIIEYSV